MEKFRNRYGISSKLQEVILSYICRSPDGTYDILAKICNRNERTIGQSVRTLQKNFYVEIQEIKEGKNRSKNIVNPTLKGIYYGLAYLGIQIDEILKASGDENEQEQFLEHTQKIKDYKKMQEYSSKVASACFEHNLFDGGKLAVTDKQDLLRVGFQIGVSESLPNKSNSVSYFAEQGTDTISAIFEPREIHAIKNLLDDQKQTILKEIDKEIKMLD